MGKKKKKQAEVSLETRKKEVYIMEFPLIDSMFVHVCDDCGTKTVGFRTYDDMKKRNMLRCVKCQKEAEKISCSTADGP